MDVGWMLVRIDFNDFNDFNPFQPIDMATVDSRSLLPLPPGPACEVQWQGAGFVPSFDIFVGLWSQATHGIAVDICRL